MNMTNWMRSWCSGIAAAVFYLSPGYTQAAVVTSVTNATLDILSEQGVSLVNAAFPGINQTLKFSLRVGGVSVPITSIALDAGTTNLPGACTNQGSPTDTSPDFVVVSSDTIRSLDCGGTAVVLVNSTHRFIIPADSDSDGIADWYEQTYCGTNATCLDPAADSELVGANLNQGDGIANFDEYRGFILLSGATQSHVRTSPVHKDVFVHLVNAKCSRKAATTLPSLAPGNSLFGTTSALATDLAKTFPTDGTDLFASLGFTGVIPRFVSYQGRAINGTGSAVTDWHDNLASFTYQYNNLPVYQADPYFGAEDPVVLDRWLSRNARYPNCHVSSGQPCTASLVGVDVNHPSGGRTKGIRLVECLDESTNSPIGLTEFFPAVPNGPPVEIGSPYDRMQITLYSQRIYNDFQVLLSKASSKGLTSAYTTCALAGTCVYYSTYVYSGSSVTSTAPTNKYPPVNNPTVNCVTSPASCLTINRDFIVSKQMQFIAAHEIGHAVSLIPKIQITTYGPHYAPGNGDLLDQRVVAKDSSKQSGVIFYIPTKFGPKSDGCFQIRGNSATGTSSVCQ
jgi:hypothetical protein